MANGNTAVLVAVSGRPGPLTANAPMFQAVELLLDRGADVNAAAANGETLLHRGVVRGEVFVRMLLEHGARLDLKDAGARTPFDVALGVPPPVPAGRGAGGPPGGVAAAPVRADEVTISLLRELRAPRGSDD
jgi:ankyrin repeat protein